MAVIKTKAISLAQRLVSMHYSDMLPIPQIMIGYNTYKAKSAAFCAQNIILQGHMSNKLPRFCNWWTAKTTNTTSCLNPVALSIPMSHWCHLMLDVAEFWITCKRLKLLRKASCLEVTQRLAPFSIIWHQCDIWITTRFNFIHQESPSRGYTWYLN